MSEQPYRRILAFVCERPWAIMPAALDTLIEVLEYRATGERRSQEEIDARVAEGREQHSRQAASVDGNVAIIPIHGTMSHRMYLMHQVSSEGTSSEAVGRAIMAAAADKGIDSILLDIDSPGGTVEGTEELAAIVREARQSKPVLAIANGMAASAAYWIGSQADEFIATPSGLVGSIGVIAKHDDLSRAAAQRGIRRQYVVSANAKNKAEGNPMEPLGDEATAHLQGILDQCEATFLREVADGRSTTVADVVANFGQGRMFLAEQALELGMIDRIETMHQTLSRMVAMQPEARANVAGQTNRQVAATAVKENDMSKTAEELTAEAVAQKAEMDSLLARLKTATETAEANATASAATHSRTAQRDAEIRADRDLDAIKDRVNLKMRAELRPVLIAAAMAGDGAKVKVGTDEISQYDAILRGLQANPPLLARGMGEELAGAESTDGPWSDTRSAAGRAYDAKHKLTPEQVQAADERAARIRASQVN